jgi:molecular chaperone HscB
VNYFEVFGLPRRLGIDTAELQRRFYDLSRRHHPDFHHGASEDAQAAALDASARVNAAYRTLRDPIARVEYLVRLEEGRETREGAAVKPKAPPELLAEMFEIQEALAEAKAGGLDDGARETLRGQRQRLLERQREEEARLTGPLSQAWDTAEGDGRATTRETVKASLATRAYLRTVIADLAEALGEEEGEHVPNHRH